MKRILCYGDSNTYGYDPRSYFGDHYPENCRWVDLLCTPEQVIYNGGENGREIPSTAFQQGQANSLLQRSAPLDAVLIMLGTNDLLCHPEFTAETVAARMEAFLLVLRRCCNASLLLIAPPPMAIGTWVQEQRLLTESAALATHYEALAKRLQIAFADAGIWNIPLAFDGVHFTEEGHQLFARQLAPILSQLWSPQT